jgi:hypothetical protein
MTLDEVIKKCNLELIAKNGMPEYVDGTSGSSNWSQRIALVKESPDNDLIPKNKFAGKIVDDFLYLHNGIKIHKNSYYGYCMLRLLMENYGVHEPQEEKAFYDVLPFIDKGSVMIELGSYWGFYSMWFNKETNGKNILVEPDYKNILFGQENFKLNNMKGIFYNKFVHSYDDEKTITVNKIFELEQLDKVAICHSDIQGYEFEMLLGCSNVLHNIDYFFISTHENNLHTKCLEFLEENNFQILCSANLEESYSYDGLIVARNKKIEGPQEIIISKR